MAAINFAIVLADSFPSRAKRQIQSFSNTFYQVSFLPCSSRHFAIQQTERERSRHKRTKKPEWNVEQFQLGPREVFFRTVGTRSIRRFAERSSPR